MFHSPLAPADSQQLALTWLNELYTLLQARRDKYNKFPLVYLCHDTFYFHPDPFLQKEKRKKENKKPVCSAGGKRRPGEADVFLWARPCRALRFFSLLLAVVNAAGGRGRKVLLMRQHP